MNRTLTYRACAMCGILFVSLVSIAEVQAPKQPRRPAPTHADVSYGPHERNVLDFWQAKSEAPTPLVIYIHGGGFRAGSKQSLNVQTLRELLSGGVSMSTRSTAATAPCWWAPARNMRAGRWAPATCTATGSTM